MNDKYYVLRGSEEGEWYFKEYSKDQLEKAIHPDRHGETEIDVGRCHQHCCNGNLAYQSGFFLIKGEIIVPKQVETVVKYELP